MFCPILLNFQLTPNIVIDNNSLNALTTKINVDHCWNAIKFNQYNPLYYFLINFKMKIVLTILDDGTSLLSLLLCQLSIFELILTICNILHLVIYIIQLSINKSLSMVFISCLLINLSEVYYVSSHRFFRAMQLK